MRLRHRILVVSLPLLGAACGERVPARFSGAAEASLTTPDQVAESATLPDGYVGLGELGSDCQLDSRPRALDGEWLSDVDCGEAVLTRALREQAAEVGGDLLVGRRCSSRALLTDPSVLRISCTATVARPSAERLAARRSGEERTRPGKVERYAVDEPRASEAWRIRVESTPSGIAPRSRVRSDQVSELSVAQLGHVALADVLARCDSGCSERGARAATRAAAAQHGGTAVVGVRCISHGDGWLCTGTAVGSEVPGTL